MANINTTPTVAKIATVGTVTRVLRQGAVSSGGAAAPATGQLWPRTTQK